MRGLYAGAPCISIKVLRRMLTLESHLYRDQILMLYHPFRILARARCEAELGEEKGPQPFQTYLDLLSTALSRGNPHRSNKRGAAE